MASFRNFPTWSLHCRKCNSRIIGCSYLKLTLLGSSGVHLNLKPNADSEIDDTIEQVENPDPRKRERTPFKALCKGRAASGEMCRTNLGAYTNGGLCFSANAAYFRSRTQPDYKCKKWSEAKERLPEMGITVESVSPLGKDFPLPAPSNERRRELLPLVFCDVTHTSDNTIDHLTRDKPRDYQRELFKNAMESNSLVYLPTGCGKTLVAAMAIACMCRLNPQKVAVFLAPNKPLVHQQYEYLQQQMPRLRIKHLTGDSESVPGDKTPWIELVRCLVKHSVDIVALSPQIFLNFLEEEEEIILRMSDVSLIVFDEAHNCQGNHPYAKIMELYAHVQDSCKPLILALTASPASGPDATKIEAQLEKLLGNLHCRAVVPSPKSEDLKSYWNRPAVSYLLKELNPFQQRLEMILETYLKSLNTYLTWLMGVSGLEALPIQSGNYKGILRNAIIDCKNKPERIDGLVLGEHAMAVLSTLEMNTVLGWDHACGSLANMITAIETPRNPMDNRCSKIVRRLHCYQVLTEKRDNLERLSRIGFSANSSDRFQVLVSELRQFAEKVRRGDESCRGIVFVKMRKTCTKLCEELIIKEPLIREYLKPKRFVGHGKGTYGMLWKEQQQPALKMFHRGECKLLVSTNVLEEGLDVPACNLVIRFDSAMSMRTLVQSRGRAARRPDSRFLIMCNDAKEKEKFTELETKEKNIENAIGWKAMLGQFRADEADERGCEKRKLDAKKDIATKIVYNNHKTTSRSKKRKRRKRKTPLRVSVAVHPELKNESTRLVSSTTSTSSTISQVIAPQTRAPKIARLFRKHFVVQSSDNELPTTSQSTEVTHHPYPTSGITFHLDAKPDSSCRSSDELFEDVVRVWCDEGPKGSWLERTERKVHERKMVFQVLPIFSFAGGDFKDRGTFSELWEHDCRQKAEIIFLHDLKIVVLVFYNSSIVLHKIEFRYDQLHEFIFLDVEESDEWSANLFLCLRHVPQLCAAEDFVSPWDDESGYGSFSDYFLTEENDEDSSENELPEDAENVQDENLNQANGEYLAEEADTTELAQPLEYLDLDDDESDQHEDSPPESDNDLEHDETDQAESSDFFTEQTRAVDDMVSVKIWGRRCAIDEDISPMGKFLALRIKVQYSLDLIDALEVLRSFGKRVFYVSVKLEDQPPESPLVASLSDEVRYAHDCLIGLHPNVRPRLSPLFYHLLTSITPSDSVNAINNISSLLQQDYFTDPESKLATLLAGSHVRRATISQSSVPAHCALVKRLVLTPTRVIPFPAEVMEQNRVLRHFDSERFLCVNVREEDYSKLRGQQARLNQVLDRIKAFMDNGIEIGGQWYQFVGCSNSQMRSHGCWFVRPTLRSNADSIRQWMGDFSSIRCVAMYMARLGQCFSTSLDTIGITLEEGATWIMIDEVERDGFCFSDGVGTISTNLAREVCVKVGKPGTRSALQMRFAGSKGVLCQDPNIPDNYVCIRGSMRKFESNHRRLELLQTSRPQAVYLNHQIIMLLSNLGVPDEIFLDLQQRVLDNLAAMMIDENEALQRMSNMIRTGINYKAQAECGVSLTTEPYFKSLLCALYKEQMYKLLKKSRILLPVSESRLMMGVMDETGILEYGQVFVQCSRMTSEGDNDDELEPEGQRFIVKHRVVVTRNPCLHPGDIRELEAVDVPELRHLVDCVVFPKNGPRPHPNEMAGGDLDGDLYFVSWSDDFKPRRDLFPPMKYPALEKKLKNGAITVDDMTSFFTEYIETDQLGIIDTAHKALADKEEEGIESVYCLRLAEAHSLAVDAPKTGMWPSCPHNPKEHPDFMMNPTKPSYVSQKVIGKLFRECRDFEETMKHTLPATGVQYDAKFLVPGFHVYLRSAATTYQEYASEVKTLMTLYGIRSEGEVMSGCFHKLKGDFGRERSQIAGVVRKLLSQMRTNFRALFFREFSKDGERLSWRQITLPMQQKASAWYYHAYKATLDPPRPSESDGETSVQFVSFPWVVDDVLAAVLRRAGHSTQVPAALNADVTSTKVGQSIYELFTNEAPSLLSGYKARTELSNVVSRAINTRRPHRQLVMFGSSASLLFRPDSDLDLCVLGEQERQCHTKEAQVKTLEEIEPLLRKAFGRVELVKTARVPVMRLGKLKNPRASPREIIQLPCDISADRNGFIKARVLASFFTDYPWLLPLIRLVVTWAHAAGLTNKVDGVRTNTNVLVFMVLAFCVQAKHVSPSPVRKILENLGNITQHSNAGTELWDNITAWIANESGRGEGPGLEPSSAATVGRVLLEFFQKRQEILNNAIPECFARLLDATTFMELLNSGDVQLLREQMQAAYHVLALHGNANTLLDVSSAQIQRTFTMSGIQSLVIAGSERVYCRDLAKKSGAEVSVRPKLPGSGRGLVLEARGKVGSIRVLEGILSSEKKECTRNKFSAMSKCFVRGATMITFEGCHSDGDGVKLVPYHGNHHQTHDRRIRHVPVLENEVEPSRNWEESHAFQSFRNRFLDQIKVVNRDYDLTIHGELEFVMHFGRIYAFDIPHAMSEDSEPISIKDLQYSSDKGRSTRTNLSFRQKFKKPGGGGKGKPKKKVKSVRQKKPKETKREIDKAPNHSLFTVVHSENLRDIQDYLERKGYAEQPESAKETYTATVHMGSKDFYVCYDHGLHPTVFKLPRLRWFLADVKRPWEEPPVSPGTAQLDGAECDVRLMLGTSREFTLAEIRACDYEKYMGILEPSPTPSSPYPFMMHDEMRKKLQLVRHKQSAVLLRQRCGTQAFISKVTEYSRLNQSTGIFKKVFQRYELVIQPKLPANWNDANEVNSFLKRTWKLAIRLAKEASK